MSRVSNVSFKSHVPVKFFATNPETGNYVPVVRKGNIKKCQSFVIRNLNGTAKKQLNNDFVDFYKSIDYDYRIEPIVRSVYDKDNAVVHMLTGDDVHYIDNFGKTLGITKADSLDRIGTTKTFEVAYESKRFYENTMDFINRETKTIRNNQGDSLELQVYFKPAYTKQGKNKGKLKGFDYVKAVIAPRTPDRMVREDLKK